MPSSSLNIAIVGAGPSGCLLGRLLHTSSIAFTIFEADDALDFRSQGGTLDLHAESGLAALKKAGLYDEYLKYARFDGEALTLADKTGLVWIKTGAGKEGSKFGRPEIDRPMLRQLLAESLPEGSVQWRRPVSGVDEQGILMFKDGSVDTSFDLIVGADGAWSHIRPAVSDVVPFYSGVGGWQGSIPDAKEREPEITALVNRGSLFAVSDKKFLGGQQMGDGSVSVSTWILMPEEGRTRKVPREEAASTKQRIQEFHHDWSPKITNVALRVDDGSLQYRPLHMLPIGHSWEHRPGVTLLGDAAHLMTPFAGEGVNLAFSDAMTLADAIIRTDHSLRGEREEADDEAKAKLLSDNIKAFESDMFTRATAVTQLTYDMMDIIFLTSHPSTKHLLRSWLLRIASDSAPRVAYPFIAALVYIYFFYVQRVYGRSKD